MQRLRNQYVNLHAHRLALKSKEWVLTNVSIDKFSIADLHPGASYSVGIHPWTLEKCDVEFYLNEVQQALEQPNVIAIGETGIDKTIQTPLDQQKKVFKDHLFLAEKARVPVIIHSVKATQDLIQIKREFLPSVPMIIHGFRGSIQEAGDLVQFGFYLSLGYALINSEKLQKIVKEIPIQNLFIETDEADEAIENLYRIFAEIRGISVPELQYHMTEKIDKLFL